MCTMVLSPDGFAQTVNELRDLTGREPVYSEGLTFEPGEDGEDDCLCIVDVPATLAGLRFTYDEAADEYEVS